MLGGWPADMRRSFDVSGYDPTGNHPFRYRARHHRSLPHVVKFSGGRSSGMLLFTLLENGLLDRDRGDVVIFNNTSAEHPSTYRFVRDCMRATRRYGIPFFQIEFQTYEDSRRGVYTRLPSYRMVNGQPADADNPDGFSWRGEVFEELLSWAGYVPNQFNRICTKHLKLEATRDFLGDWLAEKPGIPRLGHHGGSSRIEAARIAARLEIHYTPKSRSMCWCASVWPDGYRTETPWSAKSLPGGHAVTPASGPSTGDSQQTTLASNSNPCTHQFNESGILGPVDSHPANRPA